MIKLLVVEVLIKSRLLVDRIPTLVKRCGISKEVKSIVVVIPKIARYKRKIKNPFLIIR